MPEASKRGERSKNVAINTAKNLAQDDKFSSESTIQLRIKNSTENDTLLIILKNERNWNLLLISTVTSAGSKHQTYLCWIFVLANLPSHMLFKVPTSLLRSVIFFFNHRGTSPTKFLGRYISSPMIVRSTTGGPVIRVLK